MKKLLAITHSGPDIGMGHLVRTAQLISSLDKNEFDVQLIGSFESKPFWLESFRYEEMEFPEILNIKYSEYDYLFFDSYIDRDMLSKVDIPKILMDDFAFMGKFNVDLVIDYNVGSTSKLYGSIKSLCGPGYFPIGLDSIPEKYSFQSSYSENGKILLSFGGVSDEKLIDIPKAIDLAKNFGNIILMDPANKLKKYSSTRVKVIPESTLSDILLTEKFKFGVLGGGTTKYVSMSYGLPSIFLPRNDLDKKLIDKFLEESLSFSISDLDNHKSLNEELQNISIKTKNTIDGEAGKRISQEILKL